MDPNAALRNALAAIAAYEQSSPDSAEYHAALNALVDSFQALDGWLTSGGFLPDAWRAMITAGRCGRCGGVS